MQALLWLHLEYVTWIRESAVFQRAPNGGPAYEQASASRCTRP